MPDPHSPGWRPEYTGGSGLGDVGSGQGFAADLYELYKAGRVSLPAVAERYYRATLQVHLLTGAADHLFASGGYEPSHPILLHLREELQDVLRRSSINISEAGAALVDIVDSYVATDEAAAEAMTRWLEEDQDLLASTPAIPDPPTPVGEAPPPRASNAATGGGDHFI